MKILEMMTRRTSIFLLFAGFIATVLFPSIGNGQRPGNEPGRPAPSLGHVLDTDGRIKKGVVGGFNTAGFEMELDEHGAPRFVPSSEIQQKKGIKRALASPTVTGVGCDASYDPRFYNSGAKDDSFYDFAVIAAIAVDASGNIYVGGRFAYVDNIVSYNIARYNPTTDTWSPLAGDGLNSSFSPVIYVRALAISGSDLIVGGRFTETHDGSVVNLNNIARYNLSTDTWSALAGSGLNININGGGFVNALAISGTDMFVAGNFLQTADGTTNTNLSSIARYNLGTNTWSALAENGIFAESINALAFSGTDLYVGGFFDQTVDGTTPNLHNIARYNIGTNTWSALTGNGVNGEVNALLVNPSGEMYIGGQFSQTHNGAIVNLNNIARYNLGINAWTPFAGNGLNDRVLSFAVSGSQLFVGGTFSETSNGSTPNLNRIARYDLMTTTWFPLTGNGVNLNSVDSLLNVGGDLYVGGYFKQTFDGSTTNINSIARYKTATNAWSFLGSNNGIGLDSEIHAVAADASGNVYVGGYFSQTASGVMTNLNGVARYNYALNSWGGLAGGGVNGGVLALAVSGNDLFVGGDFTTSADGSVVNLNHLARYNTVTDTWSPLTGNGLNGNVNALLFDSSTLVVGGSFSQASDGSTTNMNNITRYLTGLNTWFGYPNGGLNSPVSSLATTNDVLYVGGSFDATFDGGVTNLNRIARFTNVWSSLPGNGMNAPVNALAVSSTELFVGGFFTETFDGTTTNLNRIARYNLGTNTWSPLALNGLNNAVYALALNGDKLYIGGSFTQTIGFGVLPQHLAGYNTTTNEWAGPSGNGGFGFNVIEFDEDVLALTLSGNDLIIGGVFSRVANCGVGSFLTRHYLQRWNSPLVFAPGITGTDWFDSSNWSTGSAPAANTNAFIPAGSGTINIASANVTMNDLLLGGGTINVAAGRTLTINGILGLGGSITGAGIVVIANCKPDSIKGGGITTYIQTALVRCVNSSGTFIFPVGTANGFSPVTVKNIAGTGNISVSPNPGSYSNPASGLPTNRLARWWQIENPGGGVTNSDLNFNYQQSDIAGNEYGYRAYRISGGVSNVIAGNVNSFSNIVTAPNVTGFSDWTLAEFAPSNANVSIGGRVLTANGNGINKAVVILTNHDGDVRRVITNAFGYYRFDEVEAGQTYVLSVVSKRFAFPVPSRLIAVADDSLEMDFIATP